MMSLRGPGQEDVPRMAPHPGNAPPLAEALAQGRSSHVKWVWFLHSEVLQSEIKRQMICSIMAIAQLHSSNGVIVNISRIECDKNILYNVIK